MKGILIGIVASAFFAVTFVLNRSMELEGGSWLWSSSLRYFWMVPFLIILVLIRGNLYPLWKEMKRAPGQWMLWSFVGFVLFYAPITFAASFGPGWLIAGTWQLTILCGILLSPLLSQKQASKGIPINALAVSLFILLGVVCIQIPNASSLTTLELVLGILPVVIAAFAFPLGNRKMMQLCGGRIDTLQRVLGMTLASLPAWFLLAVIAFWQSGPPSASQFFQSGIVGLSSGVIATSLLFYATNQVRDNQAQLASVEATQSMQVVFVLIGEMLLLSIQPPTILAIVGIIIIIVGMVLHSYLSYKHNKVVPMTKKAS